MKRSVIFLFMTTMLIVFGSISSFAGPAFPMKYLEDKLIFSRDEFRGITFVYHPRDRERQNIFGSQVSFVPYIGYDDSSKWMFAKAYYNGDNWLFMDRVYVLINTDRYVTPAYPSYSDLVDHDSSGYGVTEVIHFRWSDKEVEQLGRAVADAPPDATIKIRFAGKRNFDFELTAEDVLAWQEIIYYFDNLKVE